jgi:two-component system, OmpR family, sensor histidine kinase KdpD
VFLGAAPGVGKTSAMLEEGLRLRSEGRDVVVGLLEAHGRPDIENRASAFEIIPHRQTGLMEPVEEMDLDAVLARHPDLALVDELAHTNAPGSRHDKRWRDVEEMIDAGIDVFTTLNVQHLESLNDVIQEITGVSQTETIADEVVRRADEIELVDLTQEGIRERMAAGKIYPAERIDAALGNYFRPGNLDALRELALSWTADRVEEALARYRQLHEIDEPWETKERVVVGVAGADGGDLVIRRAARLAMRSRAELIAVHVRSTDGHSSGTGLSLPEQKELVRQLGGRYHEIVSDDVGKALIAFAKEENATQLVLGASHRSRIASGFRGSALTKMIRKSETIDIHLVPYHDEGTRRPQAPRRSKGAVSRSRQLTAWMLAGIGLPLLTWLLLQLSDTPVVHNVLLLYLGTAVLVGVVGGVLPAVVTAVAGFLMANWFFTEPIHTLTIGDPDHLVSLFVFLFVALAVGLLVGLSTRRSAEARRARAQAEALATNVGLGHLVLGSDERGLVRRIRDVFSLTAVSVLRRTGDHWEALAWAGDRELRTPQDGNEVVDLNSDTVLVLLDGRLTAEDRMVLRAFAAQIVQAMEREELEREAQAAEAMVATDRLRTALLDVVSHDLRTPLATIKASLTSLLETDIAWSPGETRSFLQEAVGQTERLNRMVGRLLDASRLHAGAMHVFFRPVGLDEVVSSALSSLGHSSERVFVEISESLPAVQTDPDLLERVVANLVENAVAWSHPDQVVRISAGEVAGRIDLRISDQGPGIPSADRDIVFQPFQRLGDTSKREGVGLGLAVSRGLLEAMDNRLIIEDTPGGGTTMVIEFKVASPIGSTSSLVAGGGRD